MFLQGRAQKGTPPFGGIGPAMLSPGGLTGAIMGADRTRCQLGGHVRFRLSLTAVNRRCQDVQETESRLPVHKKETPPFGGVGPAILSPGGLMFKVCANHGILSNRSNLLQRLGR